MRQLTQIVRRALPPYPPHWVCELAHPVRGLRPFRIHAYWRKLARIRASDRAIRANGSNGKGSIRPVWDIGGQSGIPICPKCHFQGEQ